MLVLVTTKNCALVNLENTGFESLFYLYGLTPTWISNHMPSIVGDEIIYTFPNLNGAAVEAWEWISNVIPDFTGDVITDPCWDQS